MTHLSLYFLLHANLLVLNLLPSLHLSLLVMSPGQSDLGLLVFNLPAWSLLTLHLPVRR